VSEQAWQSLHRGKLSVAKMAVTTLGRYIACYDSFVVDDNANGDVRKGGGEVGRIDSTGGLDGSFSLGNGGANTQSGSYTTSTSSCRDKQANSSH
jgi:hypothetical protein